MITIFSLIVAVIGLTIALIAVSLFSARCLKDSDYFEKLSVSRFEENIKLREEKSQLESKVEHYSKLSSDRFYETIELEEKIRTLIKDHDAAIESLEQENARQNEYIEKLQEELNTARSNIADCDKEIAETKSELDKCRKIIKDVRRVIGDEKHNKEYDNFWTYIPWSTQPPPKNFETIITCDNVTKTYQ